MLEVETLHHVSICVTDLQKARQFYGGMLGLRAIPEERPAFDTNPDGNVIELNAATREDVPRR